MSVITPVKPYIKYAMDLREQVPIMAYYCKLYAVTKGLEFIRNDTSGADNSKAKAFLMNEMGDLENMKNSMPEGTTKVDHATSVENFVASMFTMWEKEERTVETVTKI
jgi:hypothetical protein